MGIKNPCGTARDTGGRVTEAQAWRKIARAFERYWQSGVSKWECHSGLCYAIDFMAPDKSKTMRDRLRPFAPHGSIGTLFWLSDQHHAQYRATLAGLLAAQADE